MCSFEWLGLHFKAVFRRLSGAKSREINTEMQFKTPKMHRSEFRNRLQENGTFSGSAGPEGPHADNRHQMKPSPRISLETVFVQASRATLTMLLSMLMAVDSG